MAVIAALNLAMWPGHQLSHYLIILAVIYCCERYQ